MVKLSMRRLSSGSLPSEGVAEVLGVCADEDDDAASPSTVRRLWALLSRAGVASETRAFWPAADALAWNQHEG